MTIKSDRWFKSKCIHPTRQLQFQTHRNYGDDKDIGSVYEPMVSSREQREWKPMIEPYYPHAVRRIVDGEIDLEKIVISYGQSSYGYDVRCGEEFKIFTNVNSSEVDPKNFDHDCYVTKRAQDGYITIPPNGFALAHTVEYFRIPRNVLVVCLGKSTYARCGIIVNVTPLEPEWEGNVVLEFSNTTNLPARIYANEGCAQFLFFESDEDCEVSYKDRGGKYQGQTGVTLPRM